MNEQFISEGILCRYDTHSSNANFFKKLNFANTGNKSSYS